MTPINLNENEPNRMKPRPVFWKLGLATAISLGSLVLALRVVGLPHVAADFSQPAEVSIPAADCRFGITAPNGVNGLDLASLGVGSYLDWGLKVSPARPNGIDYIQMVRLGDNWYADQLAQIPSVAQANPGSYWLVSNEPDTTYSSGQGNPQDNIPPATYALRYNAVYTAIKTADPTAQVGIGGLVQPTAVRRQYLDRMLSAYQSNFGGLPPSDFWHMHAFILNEVPGQWGTGMPIDHTTTPYTATIEALAPSQNDSLVLFKNRLEAFRQWMALNGQRHKPLWITEYGVLMPSDPNGGYATISTARTRSFMLNSISYLQTQTDPNTGLVTDNNHLVQRWYWWALSTNLSQTGGGLYDWRPPLAPVKTVLYGAYASMACNSTQLYLPLITR